MIPRRIAQVEARTAVNHREGLPMKNRRLSLGLLLFTACSSSKGFVTSTDAQVQTTPDTSLAQPDVVVQVDTMVQPDAVQATAPDVLRATGPEVGAPDVLGQPDVPVRPDVLVVQQEAGTKLDLQPNTDLVTIPDSAIILDLGATPDLDSTPDLTGTVSPDAGPNPDTAEEVDTGSTPDSQVEQDTKSICSTAVLVDTLQYCDQATTNCCPIVAPGCTNYWGDCGGGIPIVLGTNLTYFTCEVTWTSSIPWNSGCVYKVSGVAASGWGKGGVYQPTSDGPLFVDANGGPVTVTICDPGVYDPNTGLPTPTTCYASFTTKQFYCVDVLEVTCN
jgi:hypothetical protein